MFRKVVRYRPYLWTTVTCRPNIVAYLVMLGVGVFFLGLGVWMNSLEGGNGADPTMSPRQAQDSGTAITTE